MLKKYNDYISVLSREFFTYFGMAFGAIIGLYSVFLRRRFQDALGDSTGLLTFCLFLGLLFLLSRLVLLFTAYLVRRGGKTRPRAVPSKAELAQSASLVRSHRMAALIFLALFLLAQALIKAVEIPLSLRLILHCLLFVALMGWLSYVGFQGKYHLKMRRGSFARSVTKAIPYLFIALAVLDLINTGMTLRLL